MTTGYVAAVTTHKRGCEDTAKETELYFLLLACTGESIVDFFWVYVHVLCMLADISD